MQFELPFKNDAKDFLEIALEQESPTFCGKWAKKLKNYKRFSLRAINSYFFAPHSLKRAIIFLKRPHLARGQ